LVGWLESAGVKVELTYVGRGEFKRASSSIDSSRRMKKIARLIRRFFGKAYAFKSTTTFKAHYAGGPQSETNDKDNMEVYSIPTNYEPGKIRQKIKSI